MPLRDIIKNKVVSCARDHKIRDVAELMRSNDVGAILVVEQNQKPVGIVTDRDIVIRCVCDGLSIDEKVERIMSENVECVSLDAGLHDVIRLMRDRKIRRVPVVDQGGKSMGLVSFGDIVGLLAKELSEISTTTPLDVAA